MWSTKNEVGDVGDVVGERRLGTHKRFVRARGRAGHAKLRGLLLDNEMQ